MSRLIGLGLGLILGAILHEYAHAFAADRLGDKTPRFNGRLTLKPKPHVDPVGTLAMPALWLFLALAGRSLDGFYYAYAKQIPTNTDRLRNPKRDIIILALAGPATNLALALIAGLIWKLGAPSGDAAQAVTLGRPDGILDVLLAASLYFVTTQAMLLIVNILPLPPLDGSKVLGTFLSPQGRMKMQEYGQYLILFLVVIVLFEPLRGALVNLADPVCRAATGLGGCLSP